jgi:hypothetical protein
VICAAFSSSGNCAAFKEQINLDLTMRVCQFRFGMMLRRAGRAGKDGKGNAP